MAIYEHNYWDLKLEIPKYKLSSDNKTKHYDTEINITVRKSKGISCREIAIEDIQDSLYGKTYHSFGDYPIYLLSTFGTFLKENELKPLLTNISMITASNLSTVFYSLPQNLETLGKIIDSILGTLYISIASVYPDEMERVNFNKVCKPSNINLKVTKNSSFGLNTNCQVITYSYLSPFWFASPQLTSLTLGVIRDCYNILLNTSLESKDYKAFQKIVNKIIKDYDTYDVGSIISTMDRERAIEYYQERTSPLLNTISKKFFEPVLYKDVKPVVDMMIQRGYREVFPLEKTVMEWSREGIGFFGIKKYSRSLLTRGK